MSTPANADRDRLPFTEYAQAALETGVQQRGYPDTPKLSFEELTATAMTFDEVAAQYGEETAVNVIIARDPDAPEWTPEDFAQARPSGEVIPHILERWRQATPGASGEWKAPGKEAEQIHLDPDLLAYFRASGPGWQTRLNSVLRQAVFGDDATR